MANKSSSQISGFNVYKDRKNRDIYYDMITKKGYVITKDDMGQFNFYSRRLFVPIIALILLAPLKIGGVEIGFTKAAIISLVLMIITELFYRFRFLRSLKVVPNFQPEKRSGYIEQLSNSAEKSNLIIRSLLYIALSILVLVFGYLSGFDNIEWIICIVVSVCAAVMGIINVLAVIKKK